MHRGGRTGALVMGLVLLSLLGCSEGGNASLLGVTHGASGTSTGAGATNASTTGGGSTGGSASTGSTTSGTTSASTTTSGGSSSSGTTGSVAIVCGGDGGSVFADAITVDAGIGARDGLPHPVALGDANGDGMLDVLLADQGSGSLALMIGNGDGTFRAPILDQVTGFTVASVLLAPLAAGAEGTSIIAEDGTDTSQIDFLDMAGSSTTTASPPLARYAVGVAVADLNGDGWPDLLALGSPTAVYLGGQEGFSRTADIPAAGGDPRNVLGDFNEDGIPDVILSGQQGPLLFLGKGDGTFQPGMTIGSNLAGGAIIGDFNGDGHLDIVTDGFGDNGLSTVLLLGSGDGTLTQGTYVGPDVGNILGVADFDADDRLDLIDWNWHLQQLEIRLGNGDGSFQAGIPLGLRDTDKVAIGDLNNDHRPDLIASHSNDANFTVLLNCR